MCRRSLNGSGNRMAHELGFQHRSDPAALVDCGPCRPWPGSRSRINAYSRAAAAGRCALLAFAILARCASSIRSMRKEDREPLSDIAVAVDRQEPEPGLSATALPRADDAEKALKEAVAQFGNTELRVVTARSSVSAGRGRHAPVRKPRPGAGRRAARTLRRRRHDHRRPGP